MYNSEHTINRLKFILKQIDFIFESNKEIKCGDDYATSFQGTLIFNSTIMCLQTIGETLKTIGQKHYPEMFGQYPDIPWHAIMGLRNIISHEYGSVDPAIIFDIVTTHLHPLKNTILRICSDISTSNF